jgi:hypothetical protein
MRRGNAERAESASALLEMRRLGEALTAQRNIAAAPARAGPLPLMEFKLHLRFDGAPTGPADI